MSGFALDASTTRSCKPSPVPSGALSVRGGSSVGVAVWVVVVVGATFIEAIYRLGARAISTVEAGLTVSEWLLFGVGVAMLGYAEGYRALQKRFVPHVIERAFSMDCARRPVSAALAPLYAVSLFGAGSRTVARAYVSVGLIAAAVLVVRALPHPWRGIVDGAVAVALSWGLLALAVQFVTALRARIGSADVRVLGSINLQLRGEVGDGAQTADHR